MKAVWNGAVLAESDNTLFFDNNHYFPPDALRREYFRSPPRGPSPATSLSGRACKS
jgi:uncharacterized protein (DUF427 family)